MTKKSVATTLLAAVFWVLTALSLAPTASASQMAKHVSRTPELSRVGPPAVLGLELQSEELPATGGTDIVLAMVGPKASCRLELPLHPAVKVHYQGRAVPCGDMFKTTVVVGPNRTGAKVILKFQFVASTTGGKTTRAMPIVVSGSAQAQTPATTPQVMVPPPAAGASFGPTAADLSVTTAPVLPEGRAGTGYKFQLSASGGRAPYRWELVSTPPAGLSLSASGRLSGTPTTAGPTYLLVEVLDSTGASASCTLSLMVAPAGP